MTGALYYLAETSPWDFFNLEMNVVLSLYEWVVSVRVHALCGTSEKNYVIGLFLLQQYYPHLKGASLPTKCETGTPLIFLKLPLYLHM